MPPPIVAPCLPIPSVRPKFTVDIHRETERALCSASPALSAEFLTVSSSRRACLIHLRTVAGNTATSSASSLVVCVLVSKDLKHIQVLHSSMSAWDSAVASTGAAPVIVPDVVPDRESLFRLCLHLHAAAAAKRDPPPPTRDVLSCYARRGLPQYVTTSAPVDFDPVSRRLALPVLRLWTGLR